MFAPGGEVAGSHFILGDINSPWPLHFAEGYATGNAIHTATGRAVVVAFSAHNLEPVAKAYRECFPDRTFLICIIKMTVNALPWWAFCALQYHGRRVGEGRRAVATMRSGCRFLVPDIEGVGAVRDRHRLPVDVGGDGSSRK
jgi:hypothetical protein